MPQPGLLQLFPEPTGSILSASQRTELQCQAALLSSIPRPDLEQTHMRAPMKVSVRVLCAEGCPDQSCGCLFWSHSALRDRYPPMRKRYLWPTLGDGELLVELGAQREACPPWLRAGQPCRRPSPGGDGLHPTAAAPTPAPWAATSNHSKTATVRQKTLICSIYHQLGARLSTKKPLCHQSLKTAHFAFKENEARRGELTCPKPPTC